MLELPAPAQEPQAEPTRLPFCLRPQAIRFFAAVCKFLLELVIMILYLPPGTPATARNLALAGARGCIYLVISGLGYTLVLTIQSQGDPEQATWITSTVNDALGVPDLSCHPLVRQKRGALDFLFRDDEVTTLSPTLPDSILKTTLQPAFATKAELGITTIASKSPPSQPLDPRRKQETQVFENPATQDQSFPSTETPSSTDHASTPTATSVLSPDLLDPEQGLPSTMSSENPCTILQEQKVTDLQEKLDHVQTQLNGQMDLVAQYNGFMTSTEAKQKKLEIDLNQQTQKVHELTAELGLQVDLVAQYDAFLTSTEEKTEVLKENLNKQTQAVQALEAELANQKNPDQTPTVPNACLEKILPSATTGKPDAPLPPSRPDSKAKADNVVFPILLLSHPLVWVTVGGAGIILTFFAILTGWFCSARRKNAQLRLDQKVALPDSSVNQPILKRIKSVGKNGKESLVDLTQVGLSASI